MAKTTRDEKTKLTPREHEIACAIAVGWTNRKIAEVLGISVKTVDTHRLNILRRLGLDDADASKAPGNGNVLLARHALRQGWVSL